MEQRNVLSPGQPGGRPLNRDTIAAKLAARPALRRSDAGNALLLGGDPRAEPVAPERLLVPAAVLVPLVAHPGGMTVLLTQRTAHLSHHAGQVSFPGGRIEEADDDPLAAALRETEEEIGLAPERVDILGWLDDYVTGTGFRITPAVGLIRPPFALTPDPFEVAEVFEVPLDFILDSANHKRHTRLVEGRERRYHAIPYGERYIWGATAGMLINLFEILRS